MSIAFPRLGEIMPNSPTAAYAPTKLPYYTFSISCMHRNLHVVNPWMYLFFSTGMQGYVDAVLDLASHFITRLRRYASFCRTLASHAVGASSSSGNSRNMVTSPTNNSPSPSNNQG
jgi:hypothetical protein